MSSDYAIEAEGLEKSYGDVRALAGIDLRARGGQRARRCSGPTAPARPPPCASSPPCCRPTAARRGWPGLDVVADAAALRSQIGLAGQYAAVDENLTGAENLELVGPALPPRQGQVARAGQRAAGALRARRGGRPPGAHLLRRHAPPAGPGRRARGRPARALPRRAHHRPGPAQPREPARDDRAARGRGHHGAAHHADARRGRPPGRQHLGDRPRQGDRRGHLGRAEGPRGRRAPGGDPRWRAPARRTPIEALAPLADDRPACEGGVLKAPLRHGNGGIAEAVRRLDSAGVGIDDIALRRPTLDDVFIALTGRAAEHEQREGEERRARRGGGRVSALQYAASDTLVLAKRNLVAHPAGARPADRLHRPADHVRAAVRVRVRRRDQRAARVRRLHRLPDAGHRGADDVLRRLRDGDRPVGGPAQGPDRPLPVAADGALGRARRAARSPTSR